MTATPIRIRDAQAATERPLLIDDSLSLINRTGAHFIARDLVTHFAARAHVRRWRLFGDAWPEGLPRKLLARAMLAEMRWLGERAGARWPGGDDARRLFLDPLYVRRSALSADDVVLCHDLGPLTHAGLYAPETVTWYRQAYERIAQVRPGLVFVSETSRRVFEQHFGRGFRFLHTIPLYVRAASADGPADPVPGIARPFFLTVGALEHRKNHRTTIEAYARSGLAAAGVSHVICGSRGDDAAGVAEQVARTPGMHLPGYVSDAQLRWLYREAEAFVLPSRLEGFGMPALEAALHGLIPILSRDSALNEAVGGLGLPVGTEAPDEIAAAMQRVHALPEAERAAWRARLVAHARSATRERFLQRWDRLISAELSTQAA